MKELLVAKLQKLMFQQRLQLSQNPDVLSSSSSSSFPLCFNETAAKFYCSHLGWDYRFKHVLLTKENGYLLLGPRYPYISFYFPCANFGELKCLKPYSLL